MESLQLIKQPAGSKLCGQTCLAMAAGISLEDAIQAIGHEKGTKTSEMSVALRKFGFRVKDRLTVLREPDPIPACSLVKLKFKSSATNWHWMLLWNSALYDPSPGPCIGGQITSYLDLSVRVC